MAHVGCQVCLLNSLLRSLSKKGKVGNGEEPFPSLHNMIAEAPVSWQESSGLVCFSVEQSICRAERRPREFCTKTYIKQLLHVSVHEMVITSQMRLTQHRLQ